MARIFGCLRPYVFLSPFPLPFPSFNPRKPRPKPLIGHYLALALFYLSPPFFASPLKAIHTLFSLRLSPRPFLSLSQGISTDGVCTRSNAVWHADTCRPDGWRRDRNFGSTHEKESFLRSSPLNPQRESLEPTAHGKVSRYKSATRRQPPGLGSQDSVGMIPDVEERSPSEGVEGSFLYYVTPRADVPRVFPAISSLRIDDTWTITLSFQAPGKNCDERIPTSAFVFRGNRHEASFNFLES